MFNISYLLHVTYSMLLISDVVFVVYSLFMFNIKTLRHLYDEKLNLP